MSIDIKEQQEWQDLSEKLRQLFTEANEDYDRYNIIKHEVVEIEEKAKVKIIAAYNQAIEEKYTAEAAKNLLYTNLKYSKRYIRQCLPDEAKDQSKVRGQTFAEQFRKIKALESSQETEQTVEEITTNQESNENTLTPISDTEALQRLDTPPEEDVSILQERNKELLQQNQNQIDRIRTLEEKNKILNHKNTQLEDKIQVDKPVTEIRNYSVTFYYAGKNATVVMTLQDNKIIQVIPENKFVACRYHELTKTEVINEE